jgi:hypothetical protein
MRPRTHLRAARSLALAAWLASGGAGAQSAADVTAARDLFIDASRLAEEGKWPEARERYERSLALKRATLTLYSLGVAQKNTGKLVEALESFRAFLAEPLAPATTPYEQPAREAIAELEKRIARIDLVLEPAQAKNATVDIDGAAVPPAALGEPRAVNPGVRVVVAKAAGYREARAEVKLVEGQRARVKLVLSPEPGPGGGPGPKAAPVLAAPPGAAPFILLGSGAVVLGAGVALGVVAVNKAGQAPSRNGPEAAAARTLALAGDVLGGVGLAAAVAGGIVFLARPSRPSPSPSPAPSSTIAVTPWIGPASIGITGQF